MGQSATSGLERPALRTLARRAGALPSRPRCPKAPSDHNPPSPEQACRGLPAAAPGVGPRPPPGARPGALPCVPPCAASPSPRPAALTRRTQSPFTCEPFAATQQVSPRYQRTGSDLEHCDCFRSSPLDSTHTHAHTQPLRGHSVRPRSLKNNLAARAAGSGRTGVAPGGKGKLGDFA